MNIRRIRLIRLMGRIPRKKRLLALGFIILFLAGLTYASLNLFKDAEAAWSPAHNAWAKRKRVPVVNNSTDSLAANIPVAITIDTKSLVNSGKLQSDCDDLRVVYQPTSTTYTELDRVVSYPGGGSCSTSEATKVYFKLQAALASAATSTDYYIYYGNDQAGTPSNPDNAFDIGAKDALLVCPFDGTTTCAAAETPSTATGAIRYSGGKSALNFDGASDYTTSADSASLSVTGTLTVEAWVKPEKTSTEQTILGKWDETTGTDDRSYRLWVTSGNKFAFSVSSAGTAASVTTITGSTTTVAVNTWYHVAGVYNPSGTTLDLYVNGASDATQVTSGPSAIDDNVSILYLGGKKNASGSVDTLLTGYLDEIRVSNVNRYTAVFSTTTSPFIRDEHTMALFHFDENGDDPRNTGKAIDDSGNGNHGTITGAKYVAGLVGVDASTTDTGKADGGNTYAGHEGIFIEEATTNKITNPSFENATYDTNWTLTDTQVGSVTVIASAGTAVHSAGFPTQSHLFYAENSARWWLLYMDTTNNNQLKSKYSSDMVTWTSGATLTLANNHTSDGANFAVAYKNISSNDVVHVGITYNVTATDHRHYHVRGTISGTTLSWGTEAQVGATNTNAVSTDTDGPIVAYDSANKIWVGTGFVNEPVSGFVGDNDVFLSTNADSGSSWTAGFQTNPTEVSLATNQYESRFMASLGSGNMFSILDNNSTNRLYTNLQSYKYTGSWSANTNVFASNFSNQDTPQWGAVAVSTSDIHAVSFTNVSTGAATHRRYNGTSWSNGATIGDLGAVNTDGAVIGGTNLFMTTNNTDVWMFAIANASPDTIKFNKWTSSSNTWGGWTSWESSSVVRHVISGYPAMANNTIGVIWSQDNGANNDIVVKPFGVTSLTQNTTAPYVKFGSNSAKITTGIGADTTFTTSINAGNTNTHMLSAFVYRATGGSVGSTIDNTVAQLVYNGTAQSTTSYTDMGGGWWRLSYSAVAGAGSQNYGIKVFDAETVYADGVQLEEKAYVTTYADGSLDDPATDYAWTGTTNNSTSTRAVTNTQYATSSNMTAGAGSISFWAKPQEAITAIAGNQYLFDMRQAALNRLSVYMDAINDDMAIDTNDTQTPSVGITMAAGAWQHFVFTYDFTADQYKLYQNGNGTPIISTTTVLTAPTLATNFFLGADYNNANHFNGHISDLRVYDSVLTAADITDLYYAGLVSHSDNIEVDRFSENKGQNPVAIYHFDEAYGTTASDSSVYGNNLTVTGPTWETQSEGARARLTRNLKFDGTNDIASRSAGLAKNFNFGTENFSISGWFRHPSTVAGTDTIIAKYNTAGYKVYMNSSGYLCFGIDDDSIFDDDIACSTASQGSYADSRWHHFEAVRDSTSLTLYVDGNSVATDTSLAATGTLNNTSGIFIGSDSNNSNYWDGFLDELVFYPYARSATQVKADILGSQTSVLYGSEVNDSLTQGLVGYWKMEETATPATDSSGNGGSGTWTGNATNTTGKFGNGITLDGTGDYISISDSTALSPTSQVTIAAWVNPSTSIATKAIVVKDTAYRLVTDASGNSLCQVHNGTSWQTAATSSTALSLSSWQHVSCTYDGTTARVFVNGSQTGSSSYTVSIADNANAVRIGSDGGGTYGDFNGKQDDARIYNRALSPAEVSQLYNWAPGPEGYWKMDEGSGTSANDSSGNGNTGTITTGTGSYVTGKFGDAYNFDNANTIINAGSGSTLDNVPATAGMTLDAWIYPVSQGESSAGVIMAKNVGATPSSGWLFQFAGTNALTFTVDGSTDLVRTTSNSVITANAWNHVAVAWDGVITTASSVLIYVNGVQVTYATTTNGAARVDDGTSTFYIGNDSTQARTFDGKIDETKIYNYARTQKQIVEDMNAGHPAPGSPVGSYVARWKMDDMTGTTAQDTSDNNNDLTLSSASWTTAGKFDGAWNGTGALWLSRADDDDFDFAATDDFSLSTWFKSDSATNPAATEYVINKASATVQGYAVYFNTSGQICFAIDDDITWTPDVSACSSTDFYDAAWHHVVAIRNTTTDNLQLYVDGIQRTTSSDTTTATLANTLALYVGDRDGVDNGDEFNGDLDEVKIFRFALSSSEVLLDMNLGSAAALGAVADHTDQGFGGNPPVGWWKLDENSGTSVNDSSGNGHDSNVFSTPAWITGKSGSALSFNGTSDEVDIPAGLNLNGKSAETISVWVKPAFDYNTASRPRRRVFNFGNNGPNITFDDDGTSQYYLNCILWNSVSTEIPVTTLGLGSPTWSANTWHQITCRYTGSAHELYWDGQLITSNTSASGTLPNTNQTANISDGVGMQYWWGGIDSLKIYDYARSPAQIAWDYNRGAPIAWYQFDECQGSTAYNAALNANGQAAGMNGTITPGTLGNTSAGTCSSGTATEMWNNGTTGKYNSSVDLDGSDDYVEIADNSNLRFDTSTADFSIMAWVKRNTASANQYIINKLDAANDGWLLQFNSGNTISCKLNSTTITSTTTITDTNWHHIGCAVNRSGTGQIYIDGQPNGSAVTTTSITMATTAVVRIGAQSFAPITNYLDSQVDDVRIYNYALSATQIQRLYNENSGVRFGPQTGSP